MSNLITQKQITLRLIIENGVCAKMSKSGQMYTPYGHFRGWGGNIFQVQYTSVFPILDWYNGLRMPWSGWPLTWKAITACVSYEHTCCLSIIVALHFKMHRLVTFRWCQRVIILRLIKLNLTKHVYEIFK